MSADAEVMSSGQVDVSPLWVEGGPLDEWGAVHSRLAHPLSVGDQRARFMFTKVGESKSPAIQGWMDHLQALGVSAGTGTAQVFWRLAVRQRSFALSAQHFRELGEAVENARLVTRRAAMMSVSFGFFPADPIPRWVVREEGQPIFVGLPQHHLVRVRDPRLSVAALLNSASVKVKVHVVPPPDFRTSLGDEHQLNLR